MIIFGLDQQAGVSRGDIAVEDFGADISRGSIRSAQFVDRHRGANTNTDTALAETGGDGGRQDGCLDRTVICGLDLEGPWAGDGQIRIGQASDRICANDVLCSSSGARDRKSGFPGTNSQGGGRADCGNGRTAQNEVAIVGKAQSELAGQAIDQKPAIIARRFRQAHETCIDIRPGDRNGQPVGEVHGARKRLKNRAVGNQVAPVTGDNLQIAIIIEVDRKDPGHTGRRLCRQGPALSAVTVAGKHSAGGEDIAAGERRIDHGHEGGDRRGRPRIERRFRKAPGCQRFGGQRFLDGIVEFGDRNRRAGDHLLEGLPGGSGEYEVPVKRDRRQPVDLGDRFACYAVESKPQTDTDRTARCGCQCCTDGGRKAARIDGGKIVRRDCQAGGRQGLGGAPDLGRNIHGDIVDGDRPPDADPLAICRGDADPDCQRRDVRLDAGARERGDTHIAVHVDTAVFDEGLNLGCIAGAVEALPERAVFVVLLRKIGIGLGGTEIFIDPAHKRAFVDAHALSGGEGWDGCGQGGAGIGGSTGINTVPTDLVEGESQTCTDGGGIVGEAYGHRGRSCPDQRRDAGQILSGDRQIVAAQNRARCQAGDAATGDGVDRDGAGCTDGNSRTGTCGDPDGRCGGGGIDLTRAV